MILKGWNKTNTEVIQNKVERKPQVPKQKFKPKASRNKSIIL